MYKYVGMLKTDWKLDPALKNEGQSINYGVNSFENLLLKWNKLNLINKNNFYCVIFINAMQNNEF